MKFIPGLQLCEGFFYEIIKPMLAEKFPKMKYSAAKIDSGSDVLGFDTKMSMDHGWGLKTMIFLSESEYDKYQKEILNFFAYTLPFEYKGFPTNFDVSDYSYGLLKRNKSYPIAHGITVYTIKSFFTGYLGFNPLEKITEMDWLIAPNQNLLTISVGKIFYDGLKELETIKEKLQWYPTDVWYYLLACQWRKIEQEEPFMARCGMVSDEVGSRLVAGRMINEIMKMCFLMEKRYYPYYKWFGTAFKELKCHKRFYFSIYSMHLTGRRGKNILVKHMKNSL